MFDRNLILIGILLVACIGVSIQQNRCYVCSTVGCNDPFNKNATGVETAQRIDGFACLKTKDKNNVVIRSVTTAQICEAYGGRGSGSMNKCVKLDTVALVGTGCCCTGDLCNSSVQAKMTRTTAFLFAVGLPLLLLFIKRFF